MSGVELQAHLLTQGNQVTFIFITAFPDDSIRDRALKAGAICFLAKPFAAPTFIKCLGTALKGHRGGADTGDGERRRSIAHVAYDASFDFISVPGASSPAAKPRYGRAKPIR